MEEQERPSHLVRGCLLFLGAHVIVLIIGKHDQTNEAAHAEGHLLAREHCIAGAAKDRDNMNTLTHALLSLQKGPSKGVRILNPVPPHCLSGASSQALPPVLPPLHSQHSSLL